MSPAYAASHTVNMLTGPNVFSPSTINITEGDRITWVNDSSDDHTTTDQERNHANAGDRWDYVVTKGSTSPSVSFNTVGVFQYHCKFHFGMDGTVVVNAAPTHA